MYTLCCLYYTAKVQSSIITAVLQRAFTTVALTRQAEVMGTAVLPKLKPWQCCSMSRKRIVCLCVPVGECQWNCVRPQIEEYVPAVSATTNTLSSLQRSVQHAVPIYNMRPWWRRQRCSVVLRTITRKPQSDGASTCALTLVVLPACSSGIPGLTGTFFKAICSSTWEVSCELFLQVVYSKT